MNTPDTPKGLVASPELLAELLKGSSEKLVTEQLTGATSPTNGSNALPTAVLKCLVSNNNHVDPCYLFHLSLILNRLFGKMTYILPKFLFVSAER